MFPPRILASATLLLFAVSSLVVVPAHAVIYTYSCVLNPRQETPPVAAGPLGGGRFIIDTDANTVTYRIAYSGLTSAENGAHIHGFASPGVPGGVLVGLPAGNPKVGVWNYLESQEASILAGLTYANIHTANNGGGEMRGQIVPLNALIDAAQETPPTASAGTGWATATVDIALNTISYYIFYEGLTGAVTISHFHGNALHGLSAGPKVSLAVSASPMIGTVTYAQADEEALLTGRFYVNLHTVANGGGEIRGQLVPLLIPIDAGQEVLPPVTEATAAGFGLLAIDTLANSLSYDVRVAGLSSTETGAHIHGYAATTGNAGVLQTLPAGVQKLGTWAYGAADEANVLAGLTYFNVHSINNPGGEMRGQIEGLPQPLSVLAVGSGGPRTLSGLAAVPNPFNGSTLLSFQLARVGTVSLSIVGLDGRAVHKLPGAMYTPGVHTLEWDGRDDDGRIAAPGVYFAIVRTPDGEKVTRLARLR